MHVRVKNTADTYSKAEQIKNVSSGKNHPMLGINMHDLFRHPSASSMADDIRHAAVCAVSQYRVPPRTPCCGVRACRSCHTA